ncbi:unconventional myosin-Va-like isoform X2 [Littorina saxatilis]|uniref:Dilute domain-containing protein n=1 Tax=Littorina saxatilis TaxID=31220 RepID=A0AAN9G5X4_9CAEN
MTESPPPGGELTPPANGREESPPFDRQSQSETNGVEEHRLGSDDEGEISTSTTFSKAISGQASHYMLTFENGLHDDSDSEVEELTKSFCSVSDRNNNSNAEGKASGAGVVPGIQVERVGGDRIPPPGHLQHLVRLVKDSDSELSDEGILDRPAHPDLQIPDGDSDTDDENDSTPRSQPSGGFLQVADDGISSIRPDTPTPGGSIRTRVSIDSAADLGSESVFIRPKPLSGSTTAVFGSMESLGQAQSSTEVQYRNKGFFASDCNLAASGPVEGPFGNVIGRRRTYHASMNRLSVGNLPASHSAVSYASDDDSGNAESVRSGVRRRGLSRRWSLAHADAESLEEVRLLQTQLDKVEQELKKKERTYHDELSELRRENDRQQKLINKNLSLGTEAKIEATMQHEITRMTSENLDLRETIDKQSDQIRKLKKMLKIYAKKLKDGEAAEIVAELEQDDGGGKGAAVGATVKHRERTWMGMLEFRREDEGALIKNLILDLKPKLAAGLIPGLPSYVLFMCVRHTDYINDDDKVKSLLTGTINGIKKTIKKHGDDLERITLWLANTCRLMHTLKQYSGEKQFQVDNQPRQNEMCLRNFDLSEYRQVFSDLAIWIYQTLIKLMEELVQPNIVPAILEHEAIAGLTASKPAGLRGRSSSNARELDDEKDAMHSLDQLMRTLNSYMRIMTQHAVDPELVKQIFRQLYYFMCAGALNNLLLRKDMCNWSKGMQIRYNLSHMEQWLRDNKLNESGAQSALDPIVQASQLLQARKTDTDVDSICEMCSKLTMAQIVKILNLYTPVDEFEERVPIPFIRKIQARLKQRADMAQTGGNTLLMDTKFSFPVTFPFNPSSILLDSIDVPEQLHLGFLKKL